MAVHSRYISLFAGAGGFDLAVKLAMPEARCVCYVEIEAAAAGILAARMAEGSLDEAPIWSDARTFGRSVFDLQVGGIIGGFPCPDYSVAGRRAGRFGKHGQLWDSFRRIIGEFRPGWVLLENVPGVIVRHLAKRWRWNRERREWTRYRIPSGLWFVSGDLAALGYDAEWLCLRASDVGASHKRDRWFCLAYRGRGVMRESSKCDRLPDGRSGSLVNPTNDHWRRGIIGTKKRTWPDRFGWWRPAITSRIMGDAERAGSAPWISAQAGWDEKSAEPAVTHDANCGLFAPGPSDPRWSDLLVWYPWLRPAIAQAEIESFVCDDPDGVSAALDGSRTDALRMLGNGIVPLQAAAAIRELQRRQSSLDA